MKKIWLVGIGALLATAISANASLSFVWANAQPGTITSTTATFFDAVDGTQITLTAGSGVSFITPFSFSPGFASLTSPLGLLGNGAETIGVTFAAAGDLLDIDVSALRPVIQTAGDILNPVPMPPTLQNTQTIVANGDGAMYTETINAAGSLTFEMTNFLFAVVPETNQLPIALIGAVVGATLLLRFRRRSAVA